MENKTNMLANNYNFNNFSFFNKMKKIPQVVLLYSKDKLSIVKFSNKIIKAIICTNQNQTKICHKTSSCKNCFKMKKNLYFDFKSYDFTKTNIMTKTIALAMIAEFTKTSLETNNVKIYLINQIQFASVAAINTLLTTLENLPLNTHIIFTTTSINDIIATIKSRSQIINCANQNLEINNCYNAEQLLIIKIFANYELVNDNVTMIKLINFISILKKFIDNDNHNKIKQQLLVKAIINLKTEIFYFFKLLELVFFNKLYFVIYNKYHFDNLVIINLIKLIITTDTKYLALILAQIAIVISNMNSNINLNLLVNAFLIKVSGNI